MNKFEFIASHNLDPRTTTAIMTVLTLGVPVPFYMMNELEQEVERCIELGFLKLDDFERVYATKKTALLIKGITAIMKQEQDAGAL